MPKYLLHKKSVRKIMIGGKLASHKIPIDISEVEAKQFPKDLIKEGSESKAEKAEAKAAKEAAGQAAEEKEAAEKEAAEKAAEEKAAALKSGDKK